MNILICHDGEDYVENLSQKVTQLLSEESICIDAFTSTVQAKHKMSSQSYDIALIGTLIQNHSGFELARCLKERNFDCAIIFISNDKYLIRKAFEINAFQFFNEDVDDELLEKELKRATLLYKRKYVKCVLNMKGTSIAFSPQDIIYIETRDNRVRIMSIDGPYFGHVSDLIKMKSELMNFHFFQMHQSYFVNMDYILTLRRGEITLTNGEKIPTSILNRQCVKETITKFLLLP